MIVKDKRNNVATMSNCKKLVLIIFALECLTPTLSLANLLTLDGPNYQGLTVVSIHFSLHHYIIRTTNNNQKTYRQINTCTNSLM